MIKAVIFDMYETLITLLAGQPYFGAQLAADAGITEGTFRKIWDPTEDGRTIGKLTFEDVIVTILRENDCYTDEKLEYIVSRRRRSREEAFELIHPEILTMLEALKVKGMLTGLISNCFSEEAAVIKDSVLYPFFDAVCLSYDEGICKPDPEIYRRCVEKLGVSADECLYVGDGGSNELEAAQAFGMKAVQALWYLKEGVSQSTKRLPCFEGVGRPMEILDLLPAADENGVQ